eukprot:CAMPEP_0115254520 /NCGR_PEP_ID=MMETSP0270-20121206/45238_1 /TAXON_ID=71861 /ORGANISM="Scrippsiella trochoidea, Strain CCMP3099" /LENGTH=111 /DNA_ID=CAMNT_0002670075 /DNA_START=505 /DNA_END=841 /DNA_ORIENTATION=+
MPWKAALASPATEHGSVQPVPLSTFDDAIGQLSDLRKATRLQQIFQNLSEGHVFATVARHEDFAKHISGPLADKEHMVDKATLRKLASWSRRDPANSESKRRISEAASGVS